MKNINYPRLNLTVIKRRYDEAILKLKVAMTILLVTLSLTINGQQPAYHPKGEIVKVMIVLENDTVYAFMPDTVGLYAINGQYYLPTVQFVEQYIAAHSGSLPNPLPSLTVGIGADTSYVDNLGLNTNGIVVRESVGEDMGSGMIKSPKIQIGDYIELGKIGHYNRPYLRIGNVSELDNFYYQDTVFIYMQRKYYNSKPMFEMNPLVSSTDAIGIETNQHHTRGLVTDLTGDYSFPIHVEASGSHSAAIWARGNDTALAIDAYGVAKFTGDSGTAIITNDGKYQFPDSSYFAKGVYDYPNSGVSFMAYYAAKDSLGWIDSSLVGGGSGAGMIYPGAGIPLSTGSAWGTSITNNSSNWNTAYGWGNHASAGYTPQTRTLSINGTSYDLTANRSWTVSGGNPILSGVDAADTSRWGSAYTYRLTGASGTSPLTLNLANNSLSGSISQATTSTAGYLSSTDWNTFNNKQAAGSYLTANQTITLSGDASGSGATSITVAVADDSHAHTASSISGLSPTDFTSANISQWTNNSGYITDGNTGWDNSYGLITLSSLSGTAPVTYNTGTGAIGITQSTTSTSGYLSSTDWNTFNGKQSALGYTPVTNARTLSINGTSYDLTANRSWTIAGGDLSGNVEIGTSKSNNLQINSTIYIDTTGVGDADTLGLAMVRQGDSIFVVKFTPLVDEEDTNTGGGDQSYYDFAANDTVNLTYKDNYFAPYELTNDTIVINMTGAKKNARATCTFYTTGTDTIRKFVTSDGSRIRTKSGGSIAFYPGESTYNVYKIERYDTLYTAVWREDTITVAQTGGGGGDFSTEYQAIYDAFTTKPSETVAANQDTLVRDLVSAGVWDDLDVFYLFAANDATNAVINWIDPGTNDATNNSATFTALEGFAGNGSSQYINSNYNPSTEGVQYTLNNSSIGFYSRTSGAGTGVAFGAEQSGNTTYCEPNYSSGNLSCRFNSSTYATWNHGDNGAGFFLIERENGDNVIRYRNTETSEASLASNGIPNANIHILCSIVDGSRSGYSTLQLSCWFAGGFFNATEEGNINTAIEKYMDSNSKGVQ